MLRELHKTKKIILFYYLFTTYNAIFTVNSNENKKLLNNKNFNFTKNQEGLSHKINYKPASFYFGLESLDQYQAKELGKTALITNQTGVGQSGLRNIEILQEKEIDIKKIFVPEHGLDGKINAEENVPSSIDQKTKIPVISLYPGNKTRKLNKNDLEDIDTLIFDMQDSGMRHYTYITTMFQAIESAAEFGKKIVILDRPNLLGLPMEGPIVENGFYSNVSYAQIPLRHSLTIGELALFFNKKVLKNAANLKIIFMKNYQRDGAWAKNCLLAPLSPNITKIESCHGYSFLGILGEVTPINIGVGTPYPFQVILLPDNIKFSMKKWQNLQKILESHNIKSISYRLFDNKKKNYFTGLKLEIIDINQVKSFNVLLDTIKFFKDNKLELSFSKLFDKACGTDKVRLYLDGKISRRSFICSVNKGLSEFYKSAYECFIYKPFPQINYLL